MERIATSPAEAANSTRLWNVTGWALIAAAYVGAILTAPGATSDTALLGQAIARTTGSVLAAALVAWLIVRNKSDLAKARARVIVGALVCLTVWNTYTDAVSERRETRAFIQQLNEFVAQHMDKLSALGRRLDEVTLEAYLEPEALANPQSVLAGKVVLERYRALLQERNLLLQAYRTEYTQMVGKLPNGPLKDGASHNLSAKWKQTEELYTMLDRVQRANADAVDAIFGWALANQGRFTVAAGQFQFTSARQQQELQSLAVRLQATDKDVMDAVEKARVVQAAAEERNKALRSELDAILAQ